MEDLIDYEGALDRLGGDEEFLHELLHELCSQVDESVTEINDLLAKNDFTGINRVGHGLKGASSNLEVKGIAELSRQLEESANDQDTESVKKLSEEISSYKGKLLEYLQNI
jgi:HPt (histidine-containing phosphotransfer) domain-containing protein